MPVDLPIFFAALLVHLAIYLSSLKTDKLKRLCFGILLLTMGFPMLLAAYAFSPSEQSPSCLFNILQAGPYFMPFVSFLAYWRIQKRGQS